MISAKMVQFIAMLNELAQKEANGIENFDNATSATFDSKIFYDTNTIKSIDDGIDAYRVAKGACIIEDPECIHHDVVGYYDTDETEFEVCVIRNRKEEDMYLAVNLIGKGLILFNNMVKGWEFHPDEDEDLDDYGDGDEDFDD